MREHLPRASILYIALIVACLGTVVRAQWKPADGPLMTRWAKEVSPENVLPEYPRPQMTRTTWLNLNGLWDYAIQPKDAGAPTWRGRPALASHDEGVSPSNRGQDARDTQGQDALATSHGKIVNFSSISGRRGRSLQMAYAASKAAIISVTQSAALALSPYRINVNAVCPGVVPTPMWEQIDRDRARFMAQDPQTRAHVSGGPAQPGEAMRAFIDKVPLQRAGTPDEVAAAVAFLCSSDADYITGEAFKIHGGVW